MFLCLPVGGITEEQYQNHQQQLVQMLQSNRTTTLPWTQGTQVTQQRVSQSDTLTLIDLFIAQLCLHTMMVTPRSTLRSDQLTLTQR